MTLYEATIKALTESGWTEEQAISALHRPSSVHAKLDDGKRHHVVELTFKPNQYIDDRDEWVAKCRRYLDFSDMVASDESGDEFTCTGGWWRDSSGESLNTDAEIIQVHKMQDLDSTSKWVEVVSGEPKTVS